MPNIQLRTGNTVWVSTYEFYFKLDDKDLDLFFQACEADNLGIYIDDPFSNRIQMGTLDKDSDESPEEPYEEPTWDI